MSGAWWAAAGASLWCVSRAAAGQKHPVKALLANAVLGVAALGAVELRRKFVFPAQLLFLIKRKTTGP